MTNTKKLTLLIALLFIVVMTAAIIVSFDNVTYAEDVYTITFPTSGTGYTLSAKKGEDDFTSGSTVTSTDTITFTYTALDGYTLNPLQIESDPADSYTFTGSVLTDVTGNITISASATPNTDTQYSVFFYYQNIDNDNYSFSHNVNHTGTTDTTAVYEPEEIAGFEYVKREGYEVLSANIAGDGSTELKVYYNRKSYTITWNDGNNDQLKQETLRYGATPSYSGSTPTKSRTGYTSEFVNDWTPSISEVTANKTYTALFTDTPIEYTLTLSSNDHANFVVKKNGTAITSGGKFTIEDTITLEKSVDTGYHEDFSYSTEVANSYTFSNDTFTEVYSNLTITYNAVANTDTAYTVKIYKQKLVGDEYDLVEETRYGTTGASVTIDDAITGFDKISADTDNIAGDGSLVLEAYYDRKTYTVTWQNYDETTELEVDADVRYGTKPEYNSDTPTKSKDGYTCTFDGWLPAINPTDIVDDDITYVAQFSEVINTYTITYDEYLDGQTLVVTYNSLYELQVPTRAGHLFNGWYYGSTQLTEADGVSLAVYSYLTDISITSEWTAIAIELDQTSITIENNISATTQLTATVTPAGSSTVVFTTSNDKAFIVDQTGLVTCVGTGRAVIRATLDNGGAYAECAFLSIDKIISNGTVLLYVDINKGVDLDDFAILCSEVDTVGYISSQVLDYLKIKNGYVDRTAMNFEIDKTKTVSEVFKDEDELVINLIYNVGKSKNNIVSYKLSCESAEYDTNVYLKDVIAKEGYKLGNIVVKNEKMVPVTTYQAEKYFVMPNDNAEVDVLLSEVKVDSTTINKIEVETPNGIDAEVKIIINSKSVDSFDSKISIIDEKQVIFAGNSSFKLGDDDYNYDKEYVVRMPMPKEFINRDGIRVLYTLNGQTYVKQVSIENDEIEFTLMGSGDFVFIANTHESTVYLYWLVILLLFIDLFLGMILLIMAIEYQDALQRRRELNGYSSFLPVLLLGAVIASELAFVVFLGVVLIVELVCIAWLGLKLSNKYFIYTTYNKLSYNPRREYKDAVDKYNKNENKNE